MKKSVLNTEGSFRHLLHLEKIQYVTKSVLGRRGTASASTPHDSTTTNDVRNITTFAFEVDTSRAHQTLLHCYKSTSPTSEPASFFFL